MSNINRRDMEVPSRLRGNNSGIDSAESAKYLASGVPRRAPSYEALSRSPRAGTAIIECAECGGPCLREERGGPVIRHTLKCSIPPRPRQWPRRPFPVDVRLPRW